MPLRNISADEFARRLRETSNQPDKRFAFFLGAGCSVSSGIPDAGTLTREHWIPRLRDLRAPHRGDIDKWAKEEFPKYDPRNPAGSYGDVMEKLFLQPEERQREVELLCDGRFPSFGYAALASLVAIQGGCLNVVLTTNFDDLMADALYLFTNARPLVIHHESLASYIRPTRTRPLVVKLHGDHRLSPQNTSQETERLKRDIEKQVRSLLHDRGLIFIGYGGNDHGIKKMLEALSEEALPLGIFWMGGREPVGAVRPWLDSRDAVWVEKGDFDELMLLVRDVFGLPHPDRQRFDDLFQKYMDTYKVLSSRVAALPPTTRDAAALKEAVERTDESFPDWTAVYLEASRLEETDPEKARAAYAKGIEQFPDSGLLLASYAVFLEIRKDYDAAEKYYQRALAADPNRTSTLGNYALFLYAIRGRYDAAEEYYRRALSVEPNHTDLLVNYAIFLEDARKEYDAAEDYFRRALEAEPSHAPALRNYAVFLQNARKDYLTAEEYYRRALAAQPNRLTTLGNYAGFLLGQGRRREGLATLRRVLKDPGLSAEPTLATECWFYALAHGPVRGRMEALRNLKRLLRAGARSPRWDLTLNIARARDERHPYVDWLEKVAAVIADEADIQTLEKWKRWKEA